jgi:hypothetical protein
MSSNKQGLLRAVQGLAGKWTVYICDMLPPQEQSAGQLGAREWLARTFETLGGESVLPASKSSSSVIATFTSTNSSEYL